MHNASYAEVKHFAFSKEENKIICMIYSVHKRKTKYLINKTFSDTEDQY